MISIPRLLKFLQHPYEHMKAAWKKMNPFEKWQSLRKCVFFCGEFIQIEVFTKHPNGPILYSIVSMSIFSAILIVYTTYHYVAVGEFTKIIPTYCMFGILISTYSAAWNLVLKDRLKWVPLLEMANQHVYRNDRRPTAYNRICSECMDYTLKLYVVTVTVVILSFVGAFIGPAYAYIQDGTIVTLYEVRIPFLQDDPHTEFVINMSWQLYITVGVPGLFGIEGMIAIVNNTVTVTSKLNEQELNELSDGMEIGEIGGEEAGKKMTKIFMKIIYMDGYIKKFGDMWYWRLFLSPPSFTFAIAISIYSQYVLGFPAGYGIAVCSYVQMAILCKTGQNIVDRNDRLLEALCKFKWYLLPTEYQKDVMHMIHHLQNKEGLTMGPFEQLNYETLEILTKKIYSFTMFLIQLE